MEKEKIFFCGGEEKPRREMRKVFGEGKNIFLLRSRKTEIENEEYLEKENIFLGGEGKTERQNEESIWRRKNIFFGQEEKRRRKWAFSWFFMVLGQFSWFFMVPG